MIQDPVQRALLVEQVWSVIVRVVVAVTVGAVGGIVMAKLLRYLPWAV
jgi:putative effector of murein hydrolase